MPRMVLTSVVLPQPFGPKTQHTSPLSTVKFTYFCIGSFRS